MYLDGYVLIGRRPRPEERRQKRSSVIPVTYTVHREDCYYIARARELHPAPEQPYIGTKACTICKPDKGFDMGGVNGRQ